MKIGIIGSNDYKNFEYVQAIFEKFPLYTEIITTEHTSPFSVNGVAEFEAKLRGLKITRISANWKHEGKLAGRNRNIRIVQACDRLLCYSTGSIGVNQAIRYAKGAGKQYYVVGPDGLVLERG